MPLNVQVTGTAASGRKNGVDYKVQTIASTRKDATEIWYQATGTNAAGRRSVWRRQSGGWYVDHTQVPNWQRFLFEIVDNSGNPIMWFTFNTPESVIQNFLSGTHTVQIKESSNDLWWNPDLEIFDFPYNVLESEYWNGDPPYRYGFFNM